VITEIVIVWVIASFFMWAIVHGGARKKTPAARARRKTPVVLFGASPATNDNDEDGRRDVG
jgi:hypothetical protein